MVVGLRPSMDLEWRCSMDSCLDQNAKCEGPLTPYVMEHGVFFRCKHHTLKDMLRMSKWGEGYQVPTIPEYID